MGYYLYVKEDLEAVSTEELEQAIASLPDWRREKALRFKHEQGRKECAFAYLLLCQALRETYGITEKPSFSIGEHGKPELKVNVNHNLNPNDNLNPNANPNANLNPDWGPGFGLASLSSGTVQSGFAALSSSPLSPQPSTLHFNLSHCKKAVACVLSEQPVGVDVETIGRYSESLARHVLSPDEFDLVSSSPTPQIPFIRLWTQKEAIVKLTGRGIDDDLPNLFFKYNNVALHTEEHLDKGYILTVATYKS